MGIAARRGGWIAALSMVLGCALDPVDPVASGDAGCAWGSCDARGPRCVATGVADGSWLTADWEESPGAPCTRVPEALRLATTPGRYEGGDGPIGEIRCEGLREGRAMMRVRLRVRLLSAGEATPLACSCSAGWDVGMQVLVEGQEATSLGMLRSAGIVDDLSCQRGPDVEQEIPVRVRADGRVAARVELGRCVRAGPTTCVFLQGTGVSVEQ